MSPTAHIRENRYKQDATVHLPKHPQPKQTISSSWRTSAGDCERVQSQMMVGRLRISPDTLIQHRTTSSFSGMSNGPSIGSEPQEKHPELQILWDSCFVLVSWLQGDVWGLNFVNDNVYFVTQCQKLNWPVKYTSLNVLKMHVCIKTYIQLPNNGMFYSQFLRRTDSQGTDGLSTELTDKGQRTASDSPESFAWSLLTYLMPSWLSPGVAVDLSKHQSLMWWVCPISRLESSSSLSSITRKWPSPCL